MPKPKKGPVIQKLPTTLTGKEFITEDGEVFKVIEGEYFPAEAIGTQNKRYLNDLRAGLLVAVSISGHPVPVIIVNGGVVRIVQAMISGAAEKGARHLSGLLGLKETRLPMCLYAIA